MCGCRTGASQCSRGYRQVIVTLTPQAGADLTLLDLAISLPREQIGAKRREPWPAGSGSAGGFPGPAEAELCRC
ncbi:MAG: hypothetical protein ACK40D_07535 [Cyanobacteriota bacterium]